MTNSTQRIPRCIVIAYDEDTEALNVCTVNREPLKKMIDAAMVVPWSLEDENFRLDDEFARKFGGWC